MKTYLVFEPAGRSRNAETADAVRFVREKFYWTALIFTPLWLVWHRLWLSLLGWLAAGAAIAIVAYALGLNSSAIAVALLLPSLVVAFEGAELRRRKLVREGYRGAGVAIGVDLEDAERRFFADWRLSADEPNSRQLQSRPATPQLMPASAPKGVIGLFPEPGGGR